MRKQIDIPDEHLSNLRVIAAFENTTVKKWIETLVLSTIHQRVTKKKFTDRLLKRV